MADPTDPTVPQQPSDLPNPEPLQPPFQDPVPPVPGDPVPPDPADPHLPLPGDPAPDLPGDPSLPPDNQDPAPDPANVQDDAAKLRRAVSPREEPSLPEDDA